jgi:hypothetical protein
MHEKFFRVERKEKRKLTISDTRNTIKEKIDNDVSSCFERRCQRQEEKVGEVENYATADETSRKISRNKAK